ncbi:MAG: ATP-dependent helicase [Candidatus Omnitrophota bacterium]|nr:ATP-dependent helicase [Candidatus Omnitrophota bacterium]
MIDLKKHLNPSQFLAATTIDGPVLVIAGAGSGKTRVIEYRVLNLVQSGIEPSSILLLTFTRNASRVMLSRASNHDPRCAMVEGGTFHSFAYKALKRYANAVGFTNLFSILDESDAIDAVAKCSGGLDISEKDRKFLKKGTIRSIISMSINKHEPIEDIIEKEYPHLAEYSEYIKNVKTKYVRYKTEKNYLDYDDMLIYFKKLLENSPVRKLIADKYKYIMVDEYQDTNKLQGDISYLLAKDHKNIMVVGDDAQSIYGFRGATHKNIMDFPAMFPGCTVIKLEENYRSTQPILDAANSVLSEMTNKYEKRLVSGLKHKGARPQMWFFNDAYEEAGWIADKMNELRRNGTPFEKQCVLFRSSYISIALQAELNKRGISYQLMGGMRFYESSHVKDLVAHLKLVMNPKDELAWHRALELIEGIGPRTSAKISKDFIQEENIAGITKGPLSKYEKGFKYSSGLLRFKALIENISADNAKVGERFERVFDYYSPLMKSRFDDWNTRINDLETLKKIAYRYDSLQDLLSDFAIELPDHGGGHHEAGHKNQVTLSTIHSAKGMEWEAVFLIGLIDGVFPVSFSLGDDESVEEERRLFYVGLTRAKTDLFITFHRENNRGYMSQLNKLSRFIDSSMILSRLEQNVTVNSDW